MLQIQAQIRRKRIDALEPPLAVESGKEASLPTMLLKHFLCNNLSRLPRFFNHQVHVHEDLVSILLLCTSFDFLPEGLTGHLQFRNETTLLDISTGERPIEVVNHCSFCERLPMCPPNSNLQCCPALRRGKLPSPNAPQMGKSPRKTGTDNDHIFPNSRGFSTSEVFHSKINPPSVTYNLY